MLAVVIPILAVVITLVATRALPLFRAIQAKIDRINLVLREGLTGVRVIRAFNRVDHETRRFDAANLDLTATSISVNKLMALHDARHDADHEPHDGIAIIWFGAKRIDLGEMQVGSLMAFLQYAMQILFSLLMVSFLFIMLPRASASAGRINEVLSMVPGITRRRTRPQGGRGARATSSSGTSPSPTRARRSPPSGTSPSAPSPAR